MEKNQSEHKVDKADSKFIYPAAPKKNPNLRGKDALVTLTTNLIQLKIDKKEQKLCIYSVSIEPELARDNYSLYSKIQRHIDPELNKYFTRKYFSGNNLFASSRDPFETLTIPTTVENNEYKMTLKLVAGM